MTRKSINGTNVLLLSILLIVIDIYWTLAVLSALPAQLRQTLPVAHEVAVADVLRPQTLTSAPLLNANLTAVYTDAASLRLALGDVAHVAVLNEPRGVLGLSAVVDLGA
jgi:hypothetical protein